MSALVVLAVALCMALLLLGVVLGAYQDLVDENHRLRRGEKL